MAKPRKTRQGIHHESGLTLASAAAMHPFSVEAAAQVTHSPGRIGYTSGKVLYNRLFVEMLVT